MIDLRHARLIGSGHERHCFLHPDDAARVIKVVKPGARVRGQNQIEWTYSRALAARGASFTHIPHVFGMAPTTLGDGLLCERIAEPDGSASPALHDLVAQGRLSIEESQRLLDGLLADLLRDAIVFVDVGSGNVLCQSRPDGTRRLVIVDGLGARHPGFKLWLRSRFPALARAKMRRQWPLFLRNFQAAVQAQRPASAAGA